MYTDYWLPHPKGHGIKNYPQPVEGEVEESWCNSTHEFRRMSTNKVYRRSLVYCEQSPYGWELLGQQETVYAHEGASAA